MTRRLDLGAWILAVTAMACSVEETPEGPPGTAGTGAVSPSGGSGGLAGSGGGSGAGGNAVAGSGGVSGTPGTGGTGGSAGSGTGGSAAGAPGGSAGASVAGSAGEGPAGAAGTSGAGGAAGASGAGGVANGGAAGSAGSGTAGAGGDRCDVGVEDPTNPPTTLSLSGSLGTHDPTVIEASGRFYLFHTGGGMGLGSKVSDDFSDWGNGSTVFQSNPGWIAPQVPGVSNLWAPDISSFGGQYHLYYSASTFGENRSCIGHATRAALDTGSWADQGEVICSNVDTNDNWNAIDPNLVIDTAGQAWLSFGSFWSGIKMIQIDPTTGARMGTELLSLANRPNAGGALEAPYIVRRCGYYYLFVSWDRCCQGSDSTYNIRVGRSENVEGPYFDKEGTAMTQGGGTLLVEGDTRWRGPGHNAVIFRGTEAFNVYHAYDANANGRVTLRISELVWDAEGWPISGGP